MRPIVPYTVAASNSVETAVPGSGFWEVGFAYPDETAEQDISIPEGYATNLMLYSGDPGTVPDVAASVRKGKDNPDVLLEAIAACLER